MSRFFGFFRSPPRPPSSSSEEEKEEKLRADQLRATTMSLSPQPQPLPMPAPLERPSRKRRTTPPESGRTAAAVARRWRALERDAAVEAEKDEAVCETTITPPNEPSRSGWITRMDSLRLAAKETSPDVKMESGSSGGEEEGEELRRHQLADVIGGSYTVTEEGRVVVRREASGYGNVEASSVEGDNEDEDENEDEDSEGDDHDHDGSGTYMPDEVLPSKEKADPNDLDLTDGDDYGDSDEDEEEEDGVDEDWSWLFEEEPPPATEQDTTTDWPVDPDELRAYEEGLAAIADSCAAWTADERRLHRLLALRGFHPLLPATWTRDFLGVPMYPSLFAPADADPAKNPTAITNHGSQFRATKALRALFDLQSRVSALRQTGGATRRIGAVVERELRRYAAWAAADCRLAERCGPLAAMPNVAAKQFFVGAENRPKGGGGGQEKGGGRKKGLARQVQDYFRKWAARYRAYYAGLPEFPAVDDKGNLTGQTRRLRPPRLLHGFVIVQHAVMLLVVDAAAGAKGRKVQPRCFADFNLSLGDRWLDASLNVAVPVHAARAAQLRCAKGLQLPPLAVDEADEDA